jgi:hypothetical protein
LIRAPLALSTLPDERRIEIMWKRLLITIASLLIVLSAIAANAETTNHCDMKEKACCTETAADCCAKAECCKEGAQCCADAKCCAGETKDCCKHEGHDAKAGTAGHACGAKKMTERRTVGGGVTPPPAALRGGQPSRGYIN